MLSLKQKLILYIYIYNEALLLFLEAEYGFRPYYAGKSLVKRSVKFMISYFLLRIKDKKWKPREKS